MQIATLDELITHFDTQDADCFECQFCGFKTHNLGIFQQTKEYLKGIEQEPSALCEICASTLAGNAHAYPSQYRQQSAIMQQISYVGNSILEAINRERKTEVGKLIDDMRDALEDAQKSRDTALEETQILALNCHNLTNKVADLLATIQATGKAN